MLQTTWEPATEQFQKSDVALLTANPAGNSEVTAGLLASLGPAFDVEIVNVIGAPRAALVGASRATPRSACPATPTFT